MNNSIIHTNTFSCAEPADVFEPSARIGSDLVPYIGERSLYHCGDLLLPNLIFCFLYPVDVCLYVCILYSSVQIHYWGIGTTHHVYMCNSR